VNGLIPPIVFDYDDFDALRRLIREHSGIWLRDSQITFLQVRLHERLRAWHLSSPRQYYQLLQNDSCGDAEIERLMDAIAIHETWFFRETGPVEVWRDEVLPDLLKRSGRLRVWSAGCSTGEEPYTLAMLLLEAFPETTAARCEILAIDISQRVLGIARAGVYDPHSLRHTGPRWLSKYFQPVADAARQGVSNGRWLVSEHVRRLVHWQRANVLDPGLAQRLGAIDAILCRNLFIYFDEQSRHTALANLHGALKPGGYLILGHAETLAYAMPYFELARVGGAVLYRKPN